MTLETGINIGWPEGIVLTLTFLNLAVVASKHGEPRPKYDLGGFILGTGITYALLYWGGFFA